MNTALAQATLAWLLTYAIHSTVLLAAAILFVRFRRSSATVTDVVWKAALVGGVVTATVQAGTDWRPLGSFALAGASSATQSPLGERVDPADGLGATDEASRSGDLARTAPTRDAARAENGTANGAASDDALGSATGLPGGSAAGATGVSTGADVGVATGWLAAAWILLAAALVTWYVARRLVLVGRLGDRRPVTDGETLARFESLRVETGARRPVRLTASAAISAPVALAGEICLPTAALTDLDAEHQRAVLAHELAHVERRDPDWLVAACLLERAFFFQPLNGVARRALQRNAEYCADAWAARHSGGIPLAKALVRVAEWMQASPLGVPVAGFAEERSQLAVRVSRLLEGAVSAPHSRMGAVAIAGLALVVTAAFAPGVSQGAAGQPATPSSRTPSTISSHAPETASPGTASREASLLPHTPSAGLRPVDPLDAMLPGGQGPEALDEAGFPSSAARADTAIVRAVIARLKDEDAEVRRAAAEALGRFRHAMAIDPLVLALEDLEPEVRLAAMHALGNFERAPVPTGPIRRKLDDADPEMRATAVRLLAELRDRVSIPRITQLVVDGNAEVRYSALNALEELEATVPDAVMASALADASSDVREAAVGLAGERQMVSTVPRLIQLLEDRSGSVRERTALALTEMRTAASHEALRRALTHRDPTVRRIAVEYFGEEVDK